MGRRGTSQAYGACVNIFDNILGATPHRKYLPEFEKWNSLFTDEFGRFRIWGANCGAQHPAKSSASLEYRMRGAPSAKKLVHELLGKLKGQLNEFLFTMINPPTNTFEASSSDEDSDDPDLDEVLGQLDSNSNTELELLSFTIHSTITNLYRIIAFSRPLVHKDKKGKYQSIDVSAYRPFEIGHVSDKFPKAEKAIAERFAVANLERRQFLIYQQTHHLKLSATTVEEGDDADDSEDDLKSKRAETVTTATTFMDLDGPQDPSKIQLHRSPANSDSGRSQTSFATSADFGGAESGLKLKVPPPPNGAQAFEEPFECPYCYRIIDINDTRSWRKHVFEDLRPYVCTFEDCPTAITLYGSRGEWFDHELAFHRREWHCKDCDLVLPNQELMSKHLENRHGDVYSECLAPIILKRCERPIQKSQQCCFCLGSFSNKRLRNHLAKHMQQLSLFILPRLDLDESQEVESDAEGSSASQSAPHQEEDIVELASAYKQLNETSDGIDYDHAVVESRGLGARVWAEYYRGRSIEQSHSGIAHEASFAHGQEFVPDPGVGVWVPGVQPKSPASIFSFTAPPRNGTRTMFSPGAESLGLEARNMFERDIRGIESSYRNMSEENIREIESWPDIRYVGENLREIEREAGTPTEHKSIGSKYEPSKSYFLMDHGDELVGNSVSDTAAERRKTLASYPAPRKGKMPAPIVQLYCDAGNECNRSKINGGTPFNLLENYHTHLRAVHGINIPKRKKRGQIESEGTMNSHSPTKEVEANAKDEIVAASGLFQGESWISAPMRDSIPSSEQFYCEAGNECNRSKINGGSPFNRRENYNTHLRAVHGINIRKRKKRSRIESEGTMNSHSPTKEVEVNAKDEIVAASGLFSRYFPDFEVKFDHGEKDHTVDYEDQDSSATASTRPQQS
ncbi:hypothetical protein DFH27DRAFT_556308 [Peziza echinospora]|nr:hypothetical protein DFH27DRAFT_556308 [Peziza echinospora]